LINKDFNYIATIFMEMVVGTFGTNSSDAGKTQTVMVFSPANLFKWLNRFPLQRRIIMAPQHSMPLS